MGAAGADVRRLAYRTSCAADKDGGASLAATNVFERQLDGSWRMVLHQAHGVMSLGAAPTKVDW